MPKIISEEDKNEVEAMTKMGVIARDIAEDLNMSVWSVQRIRKERGLRGIVRVGKRSR